MKSESRSPVSYMINVARLPQTGVTVKIDADPQQRALLAEQHGLLSVGSFRAELVVTNWKRNGVKVAGRVEADIEQECVVTLEPLKVTISEEVSQIYLPEDSKLGRQGFHEGGEILLDAEGPDSPETFAGDSIDIGALAEEFFGVAIDPYPRKHSVALPEPGEPDDHSAGGQLQEKLLSFTRKS